MKRGLIVYSRRRGGFEPFVCDAIQIRKQEKDNSLHSVEIKSDGRYFTTNLPDFNVMPALSFSDTENLTGAARCGHCGRKVGQ